MSDPAQKKVTEAQRERLNSLAVVGSLPTKDIDQSLEALGFVKIYDMGRWEGAPLVATIAIYRSDGQAKPLPIYYNRAGEFLPMVTRDTAPRLSASNACSGELCPLLSTSDPKPSETPV